jgi:hypothetical protein
MVEGVVVLVVFQMLLPHCVEDLLSFPFSGAALVYVRRFCEACVNADGRPVEASLLMEPMLRLSTPDPESILAGKAGRYAGTAAYLSAGCGAAYACWTARRQHEALAGTTRLTKLTQKADMAGDGKRMSGRRIHGGQAWVVRTRQRECRLGVREGARLICAGPRAPLVRQRVVRLLTTGHANLEAMVLRARRGTHQGLLRFSTHAKGHGMRTETSYMLRCADVKNYGKGTGCAWVECAASGERAGAGRQRVKSVLAKCWGRQL